MRAMSMSFPRQGASSPPFDTRNRPCVTVLARGSDPPEPPDGLRPGSFVTGPGPRWPRGKRPPGTPDGSRPRWPGRRLPRPRCPSGAEPAVPRGVVPQCPEEVHPAEGGPVGVAEVELRVDALPQQEAAQPLLPRGADHQVGVGLAGRVQVVGDVLYVQKVGEFLDAGSLGGMVVKQRP